MTHVRKRIGIDFDDVVLNFSDGLREYHNTHYGMNITRDEHYTFLLEELWSCSIEEVVLRVQEFMRSPEYLLLQPVRGALTALGVLKDRHDLEIVTARSHDVCDITLEWIHKHCRGVFAEVHFLGHYSQGVSNVRSKGDVCNERGIEIFIDDAIHNAESVVAKGIPVLLFDAPWNQGLLPSLVTRVYGWNEILEHI